jgi:hypothetical protein
MKSDVDEKEVTMKQNNRIALGGVSKEYMCSEYEAFHSAQLRSLRETHRLVEGLEVDCLGSVRQLARQQQSPCLLRPPKRHRLGHSRSQREHGTAAGH